MENKTEEIKRIDIKEFREMGYLQEVNRRFFHPLGLGLEISQEENGKEWISGIWDYREDPEGMLYDIAKSNEERIARFRKNAAYVDTEMAKRIEYRETALGYGIEPIP